VGWIAPWLFEKLNVFELYVSTTLVLHILLSKLNNYYKFSSDYAGKTAAVRTPELLRLCCLGLMDPKFDAEDFIKNLLSPFLSDYLS
jgi:hypothetical protein